jgi:hypothetical protein
MGKLIAWGLLMFAGVFLLALFGPAFILVLAILVVIFDI